MHFEGISIQQYENLSGDDFNNIIIDSPIPSTGVNLNSILNLAYSSDLDINSGHLWSNGNIINIEGDININTDGEFNLNSNSELYIGNSGNLNVNSGGIIEIIGSQGNEVLLRSGDSDYWSFTCFSGGSVSAEWATFGDISSWGVNILPGGVVDINHSFNHCTFLSGQANGTLLYIGNTQNFTIDYASFPNQGVSGFNVSKTNNSGEVTLHNFIGSFGGEAYDNDPYYRVIWINDIIISGAVSDVSCNGGNDGEIDITISGGTPGFTYLWNDGYTNGDRFGLSAGVYSITATDIYGAESAQSYTVTEAVPILGVLISQDTECDGTISLTYYAESDYMPVTYLWDNGQTGAISTGYPQGNYAVTVTVTDAIGCSSDFTPNITGGTVYIPLSLSCIVTTPSVIGSSDGFIDLTVVGGSLPYSYLIEYL